MVMLFTRYILFFYKRSYFYEVPIRVGNVASALSPWYLQWHHYATLVVWRLDVCTLIPLHTAGIRNPFVLRMSGHPLLVEFLVLLLECFHASLEMYFQPLPTMDGEELHALRHIATFINAANDVSKGIFAASPEVCFPTGSTIVVGNIASAETKLAHAIVYASWLCQ